MLMIKNLIYYNFTDIRMSNVSNDYIITPIPLDNTANSHLILYQTDKYIHAAWYDNQEKGVFLSSTIDENKHTVKPRKIMNVEGQIKDIKIIAKDDDFVVTAVEEKDDGEYIRAATGIVLPNEMMYDFKPCEKVKVPGKLINAYTVFTKDASMDYIFWKPDESQQKSSNLKAAGAEDMEKNMGGVTKGSHCTRLSILNSQIQQ